MRRGFKVQSFKKGKSWQDPVPSFATVVTFADIPATVVTLLLIPPTVFTLDIFVATVLMFDVLPATVVTSVAFGTNL